MIIDKKKGKHEKKKREHEKKHKINIYGMRMTHQRCDMSQNSGDECADGKLTELDKILNS